MRSVFSLAGLLGCGFLTLALALQYDPIPDDVTYAISERLLEVAEKEKSPALKMKCDADKATGVYQQGGGGLIVIPVKDLSEGSGGASYGEEKGAATALLCLHRFRPLVNGKPIAEDKVLSTTIGEGTGEERKIAIFQISIKQVNDQEWHLLTFAKDQKPVVASTFRMEEGSADFPATVKVKEEGGKVSLVVNIFGKYAADIPVKEVD